MKQYGFAWLLMILLAMASLMGCAAPATESAPQPSEAAEIRLADPAEAPAPTEAPAPLALPGEDMLGEWQDSWSQRAGMTVAREGEGFSVVIRWADSAFVTNEWRMTGVYEDVEDGRIACNGTCSYYYMEYSDDGSVTEEAVYENGSAHITYVNGMLYWFDAQEGAGDECMFERVPDALYAPGEPFEEEP